ncbi:MAG: hypothetical protein CMJ59_16435 [Planctomycetaceae bacterium]|nr:hypothetical protein [Planctomycetaceae bacterium]
MSFFHRAFAPLLIGLILFADLLSATDPRAGVAPTLLVLRNGQILRGTVTHVGDHYLVVIGPSSQVRVPAGQVDYACHTFDQVYRVKVANTRLATARGHLKLAEWCLRHKLRTRAADHLLTAIAVDPDEPEILRVQRFWTAASQPAGPSKPTVTVPPSTVPHQEVEATLRTLPPTTIERFTHKVQPLLMNYCGNSNCHGPNADSSFRLVRPLFAKRMTRRFTQRNLHTILNYIDRQNPSQSQLLTIPKQPHGNLSTPVFDERREPQYLKLEQWVDKFGRRDRPAVPPPHVAPPPNVVLTKPNDFQEEPPVQDAPGDGAMLEELVDTLSAQDPSESTDTKQPRPDSRRFVPRDPFDPQIFNRRYFADGAP